MNKLYKYALGLLTTFTLTFACFSIADVVLPTYTWTEHGNYMWGDLFNYTTELVNLSDQSVKYVVNGPDFFCVKRPPNGVGGQYSIDGNTWYNLYLSDIGCTEQGFIYLKGTDVVFHYFYFGEGYIPEEYTSLKCQTEYNLIPVEDINANYCKLNFGMIDPRECPTTEGSGTISRTPRFINDEQYPGTNLLNINIPEDIAHSVIYNEEETIVNIEGYNADENYINGILQKEKLTPTNEDIEEMITGFMVNYFPYLALAITFLYLARKIYKLFK